MRLWSKYSPIELSVIVVPDLREKQTEKCDMQIRGVALEGVLSYKEPTVKEVYVCMYDRFSVCAYV